MNIVSSVDCYFRAEEKLYLPTENTEIDFKIGIEKKNLKADHYTSAVMYSSVYQTKFLEYS